MEKIISILNCFKTTYLSLPCIIDAKFTMLSEFKELLKLKHQDTHHMNRKESASLWNAKQTTD